jgi:hypothetical protein
MNDNHEYAIRSDYGRLREDDKEFFIFITKSLINFENRFMYNLINLNQETDCNYIFTNYSTFNSNSNNVNILARLYPNYDIFNEIKKFTNKLTPVRSLNSNFLITLENIEQRNTFKQLLNIFVILNLIRKKIRNKSFYDIQEYRLIDKLNNINSNVLNVFNMFRLQIVLNNQEIINFCTNHYKTIDINSILNVLNVNELNEMYQTLYLFK